MTGPGRARQRELQQGALAAAPALAIGWVAHRGSPRIPFAPTALASRVIRLTPGDVATTAIDRLHHAAQQLLAAGFLTAFVALAALALTWGRSSTRAALSWGVALLLAGAATPVEPSPAGALAAAGLSAAVYWSPCGRCSDRADHQTPAAAAP